MMKKLIFMFLIAGFFVCSFLSVATAIEIAKTFKKSFAMEFGGSVTVKADEGFIKIKSWDKTEVEVNWTKRIWGRTKKEAEELMDMVEVRISQVDDRLLIKVIEPKDSQNFSFWDLLDPDTWKNNNRHSPMVDFELFVPKEINLDLSTDEGDVIVNSVQGELEINVDEGDIEIVDIQFENLSLFADEGDISGRNLKNTEGTITIEVDEGDVSLENIQTRRLRMECDEGDASFVELICNYCNISTDEGDIELDILLGEDDHYEIYTDEGNVNFYLPANADVRFDLETEDGRIRSDFDVEIKKKDDWQQCRDRLGKGSSLIKACTDEGIISLRRR
ncbi:DUF4097 family beta strand repeat protein [candidate division KSB1 bacterium]|nr:DUF4097 family beta strand repeat protein [candidate division KSB1 bacterium]